LPTKRPSAAPPPDCGRSFETASLGEGWWLNCPLRGERVAAMRRRVRVSSIGVKINPRKACVTGVDERRWTTEHIEPRSGVVI
jgi:hypothetical protein